MVTTSMRQAELNIIHPWTMLLFRMTCLLNHLIKAGADVNAVNAKGETAMHTAVTGSRLEAAKILIANGCNINTLDGSFFGFCGSFIS